ncbi:hypothetical protein HT031_004964 [Scenedesmus sp. PABB004]|nr:hypothetical protein HT031_004964 [Scenedesmus sp. PABB004]
MSQQQQQTPPPALPGHLAFTPGSAISTGGAAPPPHRQQQQHAPAPAPEQHRELLAEALAALRGERAEWADVTPCPVPASEADGAVVAVQYSAAHREALGYLLACIATGERSARVLALTADVIAANSAHYTAWEVRWECLLALGADLRREYEFTERVAEENAKNYQLWNHRLKLAKALGPDATQAELEFCKRALDGDAKNYHAWAHRQVVVAAGGAWAAELGYVEELLAADVRNNSAWNQRMFVLQHTLGEHASLEALLQRELSYVAAAVARAPDNESAWNYLWGLFSLPGCADDAMGLQDEARTRRVRLAGRPARHRMGWRARPAAHARRTRAPHAVSPQVFAVCRDALARSASCKPALDTLAQAYACLARAAAAAGDAGASAAAARAGLRALDAAAVADPMRANYWHHRRAELEPLAGR